MKLKTLKDLDVEEDRDYRSLIDVDELKAEAVKWVKNMRELPDARYMFRKFFNITEEDLK